MALIISRTFGVEIDRNVVRRVWIQHYRQVTGGGGLSWLIFLGHMKDSLWRLDLCRCESMTWKSNWVLVVMDQYTRRIIGFGVHTSPGGATPAEFGDDVGRKASKSLRVRVESALSGTAGVAACGLTGDFESYTNRRPTMSALTGANNVRTLRLSI